MKTKSQEQLWKKTGATEWEQDILEYPTQEERWLLDLVMIMSIFCSKGMLCISLEEFLWCETLHVVLAERFVLG